MEKIFLSLALLGSTIVVDATIEPETSFIQLGQFAGAGPNTFARDVSADGSAVVGSGDSLNGNEAFIWTGESGIVGLGDVNNGVGGFYSVGRDISDDGSVLVGFSTAGGNDKVHRQPIRWTQAGGMELLEALPYGGRALGVSADGSVVVGWRALDAAGGDNGAEAFRWTQAGGYEFLGDLPGGRAVTRSFGIAISADGSVLTGYGHVDGDSGDDLEAFHWTEATGMVGIGDLPGGRFYSFGTGVSSDGKVIVGQSESVHGREAFRWTAETGMLGLGDLEGGSFLSFARDTNNDGSVVVGYGYTDRGQEAFYWTEDTGMRTLEKVLEEKGLIINGVVLNDARGISPDGRFITGHLENGDGNKEAFLVRVGAITGLLRLSAMDEAMNTSRHLPNQTRRLTHNIIDYTHQTEHLKSNLVAQAGESGWGNVYLHGGLNFSTGEVGGHRMDDESDFMLSQGNISVALEPTTGNLFGLLFGASHLEADLNFGGEETVEAPTLGLFYSHQAENGFLFSASAMATYLDIEIRRGYLNGTTQDFSDGDTEGMQYGVNSRVAWAFEQDELTITPYIDLSYVETHIETYSEKTGSFPIQFDGQDSESLQSELGVDLALQLSEKNSIGAFAGWVHEYQDDSQTVTGELIGITNFSSRTPNPDRDWFTTGIRASTKISESTTIHISLDTVIDNQNANYVTGRAAFDYSF